MICRLVKITSPFPVSVSISQQSTDHDSLTGFGCVSTLNWLALFVKTPKAGINPGSVNHGEPRLEA